MTTPSFLLHCWLLNQAPLPVAYLFKQVSKAGSRATGSAPLWEKENVQSYCAREPWAEVWVSEEAKEKGLFLSLQASMTVWDFVLLVRNKAAGSQRVF